MPSDLSVGVMILSRVFCPKCGRKSNIGDKFCYDCGYDLRSLQQSQPVNTEVKNENISSNPVKSNELNKNTSPANTSSTTQYFILMSSITLIAIGFAFTYVNKPQTFELKNDQPQIVESQKSQIQPIQQSQQDKQSEQNTRPVKVVQPKPQHPAIQTLTNFHQNITNRNYSAAYSCLSYNFRTHMDFDGWAQGFRTTVSSEAQDIKIYSENSNFIVLTYILKATDNFNGREVVNYFNGTANLIFEDGNWKIDEIVNKARN